MRIVPEAMMISSEDDAEPRVGARTVEEKMDLRTADDGVLVLGLLMVDPKVDCLEAKSGRWPAGRGNIGLSMRADIADLTGIATVFDVENVLLGVGVEEI